MSSSKNQRAGSDGSADQAREAPAAGPAAESGSNSGAGTGRNGSPRGAPAVTQVPREELERRLEAAERQAAEQRESVLRTRAEAENVRKRAERDVASAHKFALEQFVRELLPVKDSLELGLSAASEADADVARLREGTELTLKMLGSALEKFGVEEVNPEADVFNPEYHQAMSTQAVENLEPGKVVTVVQKGYLLNGRLVRPAMVIVAR